MRPSSHDRHGLFTAGRTLGEAFYRAYELNKACDIQLAAMTSGQELHEFTPEECGHLSRKFHESEIYAYDGTKEWEAWMRMLERDGASYRC